MIKIEKLTSNKLDVILETDFYTPLTIEYPDNDVSGEELYCYKIVNNEYSYIELKINSISKKIYAVVLVSINKLDDYHELSDTLENIEIEYGNPIIDVNIWGNYGIYEHDVNFKVYYNNYRLSIIYPNSNYVKKISMPNLDLIINESNIVVGLVINNIPDDKIKDFEEGIKFATKYYSG